MPSPSANCIDANRCTESATANVIRMVGTLTVAVLIKIPNQPAMPSVLVTVTRIISRVAKAAATERNNKASNSSDSQRSSEQNQSKSINLPNELPHWLSKRIEFSLPVWVLAIVALLLALLIFD